jgi:hypothetical protein
VRAEHHGRTFSAIFGVSKTRDGTPAGSHNYSDNRFAKNTSLDTPPAYAAKADNPGYNWTDLPPSLGIEEYLWQITSEWNGELRVTDWTPVRISGPSGVPGHNYVSLYQWSETRPATPTGDNPAGWHKDISVGGGNGRCWVITGEKNAAGVLQGAWSTPVQISGENGQYNDYRFAKNTSLDTPPAYTANADNPGANWTDTPPSTGSGEYLWEITAEWRDSTRLTNWSVMRISGPTGPAGDYFEPRFKWAEARPATPTGDNPAGWSVDGDEGDRIGYQWRTVGRKNSAGILQGTWSTPSRVSGENGRDGEGAIYPRYRVVTNIADTGNTGMITPATGGAAIAMNDLDWVLYMGATIDPCWTHARLCQWHKTDSVWTMLDPAQNMSRYMDVLETITEGAADGIFSTVFCKMLFAQQAAIDTLASKVITLLEGGVIQSANYALGTEGFRIDSNGNAEFNNVHIAGNSLFSGSIVSGPLVLSNDTPTGGIKSYPANTSITNIDISYNKLISVTGTYNGNSIIKIKKTNNEISGNTHLSKPGDYFDQNSNVYIYYENGAEEVIAYSRIRYTLSGTYQIVTTNSEVKTSWPLSFQYTSSGKTFKLVDLPNNPSGAGVVWVDSAGHLRIGGTL